MSVGSEGLSVNPGLRDGVDGLGLCEAEHLGDDGGSGNLDQDNMVEADSVKGVLEGKTSLNLVCLDHSLEDVLDLRDFNSGGWIGLCSTSQPVCNSEDTAKVV